MEHWVSGIILDAAKNILPIEIMHIENNIALLGYLVSLVTKSIVGANNPFQLAFDFVYFLFEVSRREINQ